MTAKSSGWGAYIDAVLRIEAPDGVIWVRPQPISRSTGQYPDPEGRTICVITAHNPGGRLAPDAENASAQARLTAELERRGLTWWPAAGGDPSWTHVETSAAVIGMREADAIALGAQFSQDAIFVLTPADRQVVGCAERRIVATGWSIELGDDGNGVAAWSAVEVKAADDRHEESETLRTEDAREGEDESYGDAIWVSVYEENFLTGEKAAGFRDFDDYLDWVGRREGLLCTLRCREGAVTLHGDGRGNVVIGGEWDGAEGPFPITSALACLAEAEVFESDIEAESASWGPGDIATLVTPYTQYDEFKIDGIWWSGTDPESPGAAEDIILATVTTEDTAYSPYKDCVVYLLRIGPKYVVYQCSDGETIRDDWDAPDDETAVAKFVEGFGPSPEESMRDQ
jgi:hypothetical protein